jgi:hypothetical protein
MFTSGENILIILVLINALLGFIWGLRFKVPLLAPLVAIAILEAVFLRTTWMSAFWWGIALVCLLEMAYLAGSVFGARRLPLPVRRFHRNFTVAGHRELSDH